MTFIILGVIALLASAFLPGTEAAFARLRRPLRGLGAALVLIGIVSACYVQVDAGKVGVQKLFGRIQKKILREGPHLVNPLVDVTEVDIKTQNYTMSGVHDEGTKQGDDAIRALSADGLEVIIDVTLLYRVLPDRTPGLLRETGEDYETKIIRSTARTRIRDNAVYYDAVALFSTKRSEFQARTFRDVQTEFSRRGLLLEDLQIRNIALPQAVKNTIEQKIQAEQEAQKMRFVLQKEQQEAERKRVEAQGIADYQRIIAEGLGDKQLQYEQIKAMQALSLSPNSKVVIMGGRGGSTPIILSDK